MNHCLLCGAASAWDLGLCAACRADLPACGPSCVCCGNPLPRRTLCGRCLSKAPPFERVVAPFWYRYPVDALVRDFKYRGRLGYARFLATALAEKVRAAGGVLPECLLPVPLHWQRCCTRGFNQSLEIARVTGALLRLPIDRNLVRRRRATPAQAALSAAERRRNLRGAFCVTRASPSKHVAIVDDVFTTGATAREISRVLRRNGIDRVEVWVVAHAGEARTQVSRFSTESA